jgi:predicted nucleotidyltransferase
MARKNSLENIVRDFVVTCAQDNLGFYKVILFGSQASGKADSNSDIDVALFSNEFKGNPIADWNRLTKTIISNRKFFKIEPHPYPASYYKDETDPFVGEIKRTGIEIKV